MNGTLLLAAMALVAGKSPAALAILGTITASQWLGVGGDVLKGIPDAVQIIRSIAPPPRPVGTSRARVRYVAAYDPGIASQR